MPQSEFGQASTESERGQWEVGPVIVLGRGKVWGGQGEGGPGGGWDWLG